MKYILTETIERDCNLPVVFNTLEEAQKCMLERICDVYHIKWDDIKDKSVEDIIWDITVDSDINEELGFTSGNCCAWISDYHGNNYDWQIFELDDNHECHYIVNI